MEHKMTEMIYQFKILIQGSKPPIWRRIQVPASYSFYDFHVAIQDSMGWLDCHLHHFYMKHPKTLGKKYIAIPDDTGWSDLDISASWDTQISSYFSLKNPQAEYVYDFGDNWEHLVTLEKILPSEKDQIYPRCIKGKRACPPEDCGGIWGYVDLLEILSDPNHEEHKSRSEWLGRDFDADEFDPKAVEFEDPKKRYKLFSECAY